MPFIPDNKILADLATTLFTAGAVRIDTEKGFRLKHHEKNSDAPLSPIYYDLAFVAHGGPLTQDHIKMISKAIYVRAKEAGVFKRTNKILCGIPRDGDLIMEAVNAERALAWDAEQDLLPRIFLRKEQTENQRKIVSIAKIAGYFYGNDGVALIDDNITKGGSEIEAIDVLLGQGFNVTHALVLIDREEGGKEELAKLNVELISVFTATELLEFYEKTGLISSADLKIIRAYPRS